MPRRTWPKVHGRTRRRKGGMDEYFVNHLRKQLQEEKWTTSNREASSRRS